MLASPPFCCYPHFLLLYALLPQILKYIQWFHDLFHPLWTLWGLGTGWRVVSRKFGFINLGIWLLKLKSKDDNYYITLEATFIFYNYLRCIISMNHKRGRPRGRVVTIWNLEIPRSSPALTTSWICSRWSLVQLLGCACT